MKLRVLSIVTVACAMACGGGPPSPPTLSYETPGLSQASYAYSDTTVVSIDAMGQSMELSQLGSAEYAVAFEPMAGALGVSLSVDELSAEIRQPLGAPIVLDEGHVDGTLRFALDRQGNATISDEPDVTTEASQMITSLGLAHTFFPGLPGRAVALGESWVDTVRYAGNDGAGERSQTSVFTYTARADTVVDGRTLLAISVQGTTSASTEMDIAGMTISQASDLDVRGRVLWDVQNRMLFESFRTAEGTGTVNVPIAPVPLPISLRSTQRATIIRSGNDRDE